VTSHDDVIVGISAEVDA